MTYEYSNMSNITIEASYSIAAGSRIDGRLGTKSWHISYSDCNGITRGESGFRTKKAAEIRLERIARSEAVRPQTTNEA